MQENKIESFAEFALKTLEEAKTSGMSGQDFKQYLVHFNSFYIVARLQFMGEPEFATFVGDTMFTSFAILQRQVLEISEDRNQELHDKAKADVMACLKQAKLLEPAGIPEEITGITGIIERAEKEGFVIPKLEELAKIAAVLPVDWKAILDAERFHFQKICASLQDGVIETKYLKQNDQ